MGPLPYHIKEVMFYTLERERHYLLMLLYKLSAVVDFS